MAEVSIITASYNYENYIKETIESVLNQTFQDWEMIIVDDGSKDNSVQVIKEYCDTDKRIKLYQHDNGENRGLAETVQLGIKAANSDWIIFLESDDTIAPNYIEEKINIIKTYPNVRFIYNDINMFGDKERIDDFNDWYFPKFYKIVHSKIFPCNMLTEFKERNIVPTFSCVMLHKETLDKIDWNAKHKPSLDYYLWTQIALNYDFYFLDKKITNWRMHKNSYIQKRETPDLQIEWFNKVQIQDIIAQKSKHFSWLFKLLNRITFYNVFFKYCRRKVIQIHINRDYCLIKLFGKILYAKGISSEL